MLAESSREREMVGYSRPFTRMLELAKRVAAQESSVLLLGESGTGKELVAHAIHDMSPRASAPFVAVECSGLTETLFESEMFGYEKGAFTGAAGRKIGLVEAVSGGTLFLDEVGDIPLSLQVKLLRLMEAGTYRRIGGLEPLRADFRLVAATHRDLAQMVREGTFRQDLFFRINVFPIQLPPLRERMEDLPMLVKSLLSHLEPARKIKLSDEAMAALMKHDFPGNVRELRNILERALIMVDGNIIQPQTSLPGHDEERREDRYRKSARLRRSHRWKIWKSAIWHGRQKISRATGKRWQNVWESASAPCIANSGTASQTRIEKGAPRWERALVQNAPPGSAAATAGSHPASRPHHATSAGPHPAAASHAAPHGRLIGKRHATFLGSHFHFLVMFIADLLALLDRLGSAHPGTVFGAFLPRHQLAAIDAVLILLFQPGSILIPSPVLVCRQRRCARNHQSRRQGRHRQCTFHHHELLSKKIGRCDSRRGNNPFNSHAGYPDCVPTLQLSAHKKQYRIDPITFTAAQAHICHESHPAPRGAAKASKPAITSNSSSSIELWR